MKILFGILVIVTLFAAVGVPAALAQEDIGELGFPTNVPKTGVDLVERIGDIGNWIFAIFLAISLIYIVLAAFQFVTGGGQPEQISAARQKLIYATVGIAIALLAAGFDDILRSIIAA